MPARGQQQTALAYSNQSYRRFSGTAHNITLPEATGGNAPYTYKLGTGSTASSPLPTGITFAPSTRIMTLASTLGVGRHALRLEVKDTASRSAGTPATAWNAASNNKGNDQSNPNTASENINTAWNPVTNTVYATQRNLLYVWNVDTGKFTNAITMRVGGSNLSTAAKVLIAFPSTGVCYAINGALFYRLNTTTGVLTRVTYQNNPVSLSGGPFSGFGIEGTTAYVWGSGVRTLNLTTGAVSSATSVSGTTEPSLVAYGGKVYLGDTGTAGSIIEYDPSTVSVRTVLFHFSNDSGLVIRGRNFYVWNRTGRTTYELLATNGTDPVDIPQSTVYADVTVNIAASLSLADPTNVEYSKDGDGASIVLPEATGGTSPYTYSATNVPAGMTFHADTRILSILSTVATGTYTITYTVTDADNNSVNQMFDVVVGEAAVTVTPALALNIQEAVEVQKGCLTKITLPPAHNIPDGFAVAYKLTK